MSHDSYKVTTASTMVRHTVSPAEYVVRHEEIEREMGAAARQHAEAGGATVTGVEVYALAIRVVVPGVVVPLSPSEMPDADFVVMAAVAHHELTMVPE